MSKRVKRQISRELAAIASLKDSDIDTSDIPEITDWGQAVAGSVYRSGKTAPFLRAASGTGVKPRSLPDPTIGAQSATGIALAQATHEQLIAQCLLGRAEAWTEFDRRFRHLIALTVLRASRRLGETSAQLMEDLIQEVYLKLWAKDFQLLRNFDSRHQNAISGYLKVIVSNIVYDHFRAASATTLGKISEEKPLHIELSALTDEITQAEQQISLEEINWLLESRTSEQERAIFWLYYRQRETVQSIAAVPKFGLTVTGVKRVISRLRQMLHSELTRATPGKARPSSKKSFGGVSLESANPAKEAENAVLMEKVEGVLKTIGSERERAIFWLYYRQGLTPKAIANTPGFGLTVKGVESVLHRLTRTLKQELTQASPANQLHEGDVALPLNELSKKTLEEFFRGPRSSPKKRS